MLVYLLIIYFNFANILYKKTLHQYIHIKYIAPIQYINSNAILMFIQQAPIFDTDFHLNMCTIVGLQNITHLHTWNKVK